MSVILDDKKSKSKFTEETMVIYKLILLMVLFFSKPVFADFYIKQGFGASLSGEYDSADDFGGTESLDYNSSLFVPMFVAIGFKINDNLSILAEGSYRVNTYTISGIPAVNRAQAIGLGINLLFDILPENVVSPYIGGGAVPTLFRAGEDFIAKDSQEFGFSGQIFLGINFYLNKVVSFSTELRYMHSLLNPKFKAIPFSGDVEFEYNNFGVIFSTIITI